MNVELMNEGRIDSAGAAGAGGRQRGAVADAAAAGSAAFASFHHPVVQSGHSKQRVPPPGIPGRFPLSGEQGSHPMAEMSTSFHDIVATPFFKIFIWFGCQPWVRLGLIRQIKRLFIMIMIMIMIMIRKK